MNRICVVSRDQPSLYGYLRLVFEKELLGPGRFDLIVDRRRANAGPGAGEDAPATERRHHDVEPELAARGYAIVDLDRAPESARVLPTLTSKRAPAGPGVVARLYRWRWRAAAAALGSLGVGAVLVALSAAGGPGHVVAIARAWIAGVASPWWHAGAGRSSLPAEPGPPAASAASPESSLHELAGDNTWPTASPPATPPESPALAPTGQTPAAAEPRAAAPSSRETAMPATTTEPRAATPPREPAPRDAAAASPSHAADASRVTSTAEDRRRRDREAAQQARATASMAPKTSAPGATGSGAPRPSAPAGPPQVDVEIQPEGAAGDRRLVYTARLRDTTGQPMPDADVSLYAWMPDGSDVRTPLSPTGAPGTYRGILAVGAATPANPRLRINLAGRLFDVPISR